MAGRDYVLLEKETHTLAALVGSDGTLKVTAWTEGGTIEAVSQEKAEEAYLGDSDPSGRTIVAVAASNWNPGTCVSEPQPAKLTVTRERPKAKRSRSKAAAPAQEPLSAPPKS